MGNVCSVWVFIFFHRSLTRKSWAHLLGGSHCKQSSGDSTNEKLVKESEKDLTCVSKGSVAAQPIPHDKGIGANKNLS